MSFRPRVLDLFSGAGGLSAGFAQAGYEIAAGIDFDAAAIKSFEANHPGANGLVTDLRQASMKDVETACRGSIDVLVGGPSCQGFSTAGGLSKQAGREERDPRNALFEEYVRIVNHLRPSWILFENVPGLLLYRHGTVALSITAALRKIGYNIIPMILLAADYGVPQLRRRLIFIGNRHNSEVPFPLPTHGDVGLWQNYSLPFAHLSRISSSHKACLPHVTFWEACGDLPELQEGEQPSEIAYATRSQSDYQRRMRMGQRYVRQHWCSNLAELDRYAARSLKPGENWRALVDHGVLPPRFSKIRPYDATTMLRRLQRHKPSYTITTKFDEATTGAFIHPDQARTLSIREAARLQSFPDNFLFCGSFPKIRMQIGNAVPVLLAKALAEALLPSVVRDAYGVQIDPIRPTLTIEPNLTDSQILQLRSAGKQPHIRKVRKLVLPKFAVLQESSGLCHTLP
jgi:DNA (cytosine-5)-methyltransferase 1